MATATSPNSSSQEKSKTSDGFKMPHIDMNAAMDSYKKNIEILGIITKMSTEVCNGIVKLQAAFMKQMMTDMGGVVEKCTKPSEAMAKFSEVTRDNIVKALGNGKQISDMLSATGNDITKAVTTRFKESIEEAKNLKMRK